MSSLAPFVDAEDEDDTLRRGFGSVGQIVVDAPDVVPHSIESLGLWDMSTDEGRISCSAIDLALSTKFTMFIDATYHFGIRVGGSLAACRIGTRICLAEIAS